MPQWNPSLNTGLEHVEAFPWHTGEIITVSPYTGETLASPYYACYDCSTLHVPS